MTVSTPGRSPFCGSAPAGRLGRGLISHRSCLPHLEATAPIRSNPLGLNQRPGPHTEGRSRSLSLSLSLFPGVSTVREKRRVKKTFSLEALENGVEEGPGQQTTTTTPAPEPEQQQQHRLLRRRRVVAPSLISGNPSSLRARTPPICSRGSPIRASARAWSGDGSASRLRCGAVRREIRSYEL
ncbi:hypothetical protein NL676_027324 [Syzygium grande]|nr:hypothetical protein NL676_027324 [Syzygium grande]